MLANSGVVSKTLATANGKLPIWLGSPFWRASLQVDGPLARSGMDLVEAGCDLLAPKELVSLAATFQPSKT